jgi:hypothetical protein
MDEAATPEVWVVSMVEHMGDSWAMKAFRTKEEAEAFREEERGEYETQTDDNGNEFLVGEMGERYSMVVYSIEWGSEDRTVAAPEE